jgi:MFS superfamily sulfate permease-like transporter
MVTVHQRLAEAVLLLGVVGALWAGWCVYRRIPSPSLRAYLLLSQVVITLQAVLGIALAIGGHRPHHGIHFFYGPAVFLSLPMGYLIGVRSDERGEHLALLGGCVAVALFSIRAIGTGGG